MLSLFQVKQTTTLLVMAPAISLGLDFLPYVLLEKVLQIPWIQDESK